MIQRFSWILFLAVIVLSSCNQDDEGTPLDVDDENLIDTTFNGFQGLLDGNKRRWVELENTEYTLLDSFTLQLLDLPDTSYTRYHTVISEPTNLFLLQISIGDLGFIGTNEPSGDAFFEFFKAGAPRFAYTGPSLDSIGIDNMGEIIRDSTIIEIPGVEVICKNGSETVWSSRYGIQALNSTFNMAYTNEVHTERGVEILEFHSFFNCILFDTASGGFIEIQNGKYFGEFRNE